MEMKLAYQGCCFRFEVEFFASINVFRRYEGVPRRARFQIERRLRRRVSEGIRRSVARELGEEK
jgi:hypothetical protein